MSLNGSENTRLKRKIKDARLSRRQYGFESRWKHLTSLQSSSRASVRHTTGDVTEARSDPAREKLEQAALTCLPTYRNPQVVCRDRRESRSFLERFLGVGRRWFFKEEQELMNDQDRDDRRFLVEAAGPRNTMPNAVARYIGVQVSW